MANNNHLGKVTNYNQVFDPNTLSWVSMQQPSTGGGGAGSTQVAVSSVAGVVKITPNDTSVAINAGFHFDGSGNLLTAGGSGSTQVSVKEILTSSGGSVMDGTNVALRVNVVAGAAGGSTEATVRQSTYTDFNTLSRLADRDQSTQIAAILGGAPASTAYGLVTRDLSTGPYVISSVGGVVAISTGPYVISSITGVSIVRPEAGSTWSVRPLQSSAADLQMTATPASGSTWNVRPLQSSAADLKATITPDSTGWTVQARLTDSTGGGLIGSTKASQNVGVNALMVRMALPDSTTASAQAGSSGDVTVLSSAATAIYVYAYSVSYRGSTAVGQVTARFLSGSTSPIWRMAMGFLGQSTGNLSFAAADQLAVTPPAYLFRTAAAQALVLNATSSGVIYNVSAWRE